MRTRMRDWWGKSRSWLQTGWLATAGLVAVYLGAVLPYENARIVAEQNATGLGAAASDPSALWHAPLYRRIGESSQTRIAGDALGGVRGARVMGMVEEAGLAAPLPTATPEAVDRKMVRTVTLDLVVNRPAESAEKIRQLAEQAGGFLDSSQVSGEAEANNAALTIRVPAARFDRVRAEIRQLGLRVESERVEAQDVTKHYVDREARLRNLHAEEAQYLAILKHASTVDDTLAVSEKLNQVRGEIEQEQAEFEALSKQVETVAITVSLRAESETRVFGLHWRPLYQLKQAAHDGLEGLAQYAATMASAVFYLPAVLLWLGTILAALAAGYRLVRWAARVLFSWRKGSAAATPAS